VKLLDGADLAGFIQTRHVQIINSRSSRLKLVILYCGSKEATQRYIRAKRTYGEEIGITVEAIEVTPDTLIDKIKELNKDDSVTGIVVQLPLPSEELTEAVLKTIDPNKDVDGLGKKSAFEPATPKAILWLLAGYNIDLKGEIAIIGQGRLVGKPLADSLEASGRTVVRYDQTPSDLDKVLITADIIITATGQAGLITSAMVKVGAVVVDVGSPLSELADDLRERKDLTLTPNPGGVGPMTVAALFDNLIHAEIKI
jgi:methylenetetrahydrofolate dehydrogenase (NADP+)/methenyltetrahydrofolate cyclohydrolase